MADLVGPERLKALLDYDFVDPSLYLQAVTHSSYANEHLPERSNETLALLGDAVFGLAVAHAGLGGAWLYDPHGLPRAFVRSCRGDFTTNLAYGGSDWRDLYIVDSGTGTILKARVDVPGLPLYSHQSLSAEAGTTASPPVGKTV